MIQVIARPVRARWYVAIAVVSTAGLSIVGKRWSLVDRLNPLMIVTGLVTFPWGIWLSSHVRLIGWDRNSRRLAIHIALAMLLGTCGIIVVRDAVEALAFAGLDPRPASVEAVVLDHHSTRGRRKKAYLSLGDEFRREVPVTPELYDLLDRPAAAGDCLSVPVETGRWGLQRAAFPRPLIDPPIGLDRYASCGRQRDRQAGRPLHVLIEK